MRWYETCPTQLAGLNAQRAMSETIIDAMPIRQSNNGRPAGNDGSYQSQKRRNRNWLCVGAVPGLKLLERAQRVCEPRRDDRDDRRNGERQRCGLCPTPNVQSRRAAPRPKGRTPAVDWRRYQGEEPQRSGQDLLISQDAKAKCASKYRPVVPLTTSRYQTFQLLRTLKVTQRLG